MTAASSTTGRSSPDQHRWLLGEIAVFNKLLTEQQVEECLAIQRDLAGADFDMKLGKVLIEKYYIDRITLSALLRAQATQRGLAPGDVDVSVDLIKFTPGEHEMLVDRVRERKLIAAEALDAAIDIQFALDEHGIDKQLGEICIEKGILSRDIVSDVLARHEEVRRTLAIQKMTPEDAADEPPDEAPEPASHDSGVFRAVHDRLETKAVDKARIFRLGRLAQEKNLLSHEQVEECLYLQFRMKELGIIKKLGEVAVERSFLSKPDVRRLLQLQRQRVSRIAWKDLTRAGPVAEADRPLVEHLQRSGVLGEDEIGECRYVQGFMLELGIERDLADVFVDKEFLDQEIVDGIRKELARKKDAAERRPLEEGPTQVGNFTLKSTALEDAYKSILDQLELDGVEPEPPRRETLQTLAKKKSPQRRAAMRGRNILSSRPFWYAAGTLLTPLALAGTVVTIQAIAENRRKAAGFEAQREEEARRIEATAQAGREAEDAYRTRVDEETFAALDLMRQLASAPRVQAQTMRHLEKLARRIGPRLEGGPYAGDVPMFLGRVLYRRIEGEEYPNLDRDTRRRWVEAAIAHLEEARTAYGLPAAASIVSSDATDPRTGQSVDLSLRLPPDAPEHRLYRELQPGFYSAERSRIDYLGRADVALQEVELLLVELARILDRLGPS